MHAIHTSAYSYTHMHTFTRPIPHSAHHINITINDREHDVKHTYIKKRTNNNNNKKNIQKPTAAKWERVISFFLMFAPFSAT